MTEIAEIEKLRRSVRRMQQALVGILGIGLVLTLGGFASANHAVLRVKGIIVEDQQGRARILIGAPIPVVEERIRTNLSKHKSAFADIYPNGDVSPAAQLDNKAFGMLVLDANGHDRLAVGSAIPDPLNGKRLGESNGIAWNDARGVERGGGGHMVNPATGLDRSVIGLDSPHGEGAGLIADKDGTAGMWVNDTSRSSLLFHGVAMPKGMFGSEASDVRLGRVVKKADGTDAYSAAE